MTDSKHLGLPYLDAAQAQKHVTHNEALALLDALTHLSVSARNVTAPPASPSEGARVLVGTGATGVFSGKSGQIAAFLAGGWTFSTPKAGWRAYVESEDALLYFDGATWRDVGLTLHELQNVALLGVGATATPTNPLSAKLNAALFAARAVAEGGTGDLRVTLNKESAAKTASQIFQSNWSGRAEMGLTGDDNFRLKVSADGSAWKEAMVVDASSGVVSFPFAGPTKIAAFTTTGVYTPSPGIKFADVILFGPGGGGGSGACAATGAAASGGGGGGGGSVVRGRFTATQIGASRTVTVGAGGGGGAAQTLPSSAGVDGAPGGATSFGALLRANGGGGGAGGGLGIASGGGGSGGQGNIGGNSGIAATGGNGAFGVGNGGSGAAGAMSTTPGVGSGGGGAPTNGGVGAVGGLALAAPAGGGGGGGVTAANGVSAGGAGGGVYVGGAVQRGAAGAAGATGGDGPSWIASGPLEQAGAGGGGGGSSLTAAGGGGAGGAGGGGGGGGGAARNGGASGAGGAGGDGYALVIEYF